MAASDTKYEVRISALAVSRGIGIGPLLFYEDTVPPVIRRTIGDDEVEAEISRFQKACADATGALRNAAKGDASARRHTAAILDVHLLILEQSPLAKNVIDLIRRDRISAEWALSRVAQILIDTQSAITDAGFREKSVDIDDAISRLMALLDGRRPAETARYAGAVVAARELHPSTVLELAKQRPAAILTERGGWTSHTSIIAREAGIPMVAGMRDIQLLCSPGDRVIADGFRGDVFIRASAETASRLSNRVEGGETAALRTVQVSESNFIIRANAESPEAYARSAERGARGIGLYRSEHLIRRDGSVPSEQEQFVIYRSIAGAVGEDGVRIRTFDVTADQLDPAIRPARNPALGLRSIRLSLTRDTHFRAQIRALLRASHDRRLDIILPMIPGPEEVSLCKRIIAEERDTLIQNGIPVGDPRVGAMIELPSSVLMADDIARAVDFLCLGTNDLVQYLLGVDRDDEAVARWYQSVHPAVVRAISIVQSAADKARIPLAVCGEIAGSPFYLPLLVGLGVREVSGNVSSISRVRDIIDLIDRDESIELANRAKSLTTAADIESLLLQHFESRWPGLSPNDVSGENFR